MSEIKDGGPAFPMAANEYAGNGPCWGMSLRDYFAAKALPQVMAENPNSGNMAVSKAAYDVADAMLRAREAS